MVDAIRTVEKPMPGAMPKFTASSCLITLLVACAEPSPKHVASTATKSAVAMDPVIVRRLVDSRMQVLNQYILVDARTSGTRFDQYNRWLRAVGRALVDRQAAPSATDALTVDAALELEPFRRPNPQTHDLMLLAAIKEQSDLAKLGPLVVRMFGDDSIETRQLAASHLVAGYSLP